MIHIYCGDGKGKTTAAMGLALRALGHGEHVLIAQFLKDGRSGELAALRRFPGATVWEGIPVRGFISRMTDAQREQTRAQQTAQAEALTAAIAGQQPDLVVLDELALALARGMVETSAARALLNEALRCAETIVTGRCAPDWLCEQADYVSMIAAQKHPFATEGLAARKGVEW